jgi:peptidoglycan/xylan/chitin deacetylase (PgdA/CDA1 family)
MLSSGEPRRSTIERFIDLSLSISPLQPVMRWQNASRLAVLAYHDIRDQDRFAEHMRHLARHARVVSGEEVKEAIRGGNQLPRRAVMVTFDDGDRSVFERAAPILVEMRIPAIVFVVAGLIDSEQMFWWDEAEFMLSAAASGDVSDTRAWPELLRYLKSVPNERRLEILAELRARAPGLVPCRRQLRTEELRELARSGIEIGNHTLTHPCLDRCGLQTALDEVSRGHALLAELTGTEPRYFAFPNGNFDGRVIPALESLGYSGAFLFDHRIARFPPSNEFTISRLRVNSTTTPERFRTILTGLHPLIHHALGRP